MSTPSRNLRAPQATSVDKHPQRAAILKDIENERGSEAQIARRYGISAPSVRQLKARMFSEIIAQKRKERDLRTVDGLLLKLKDIADKADENIDSFRDYLADPDDPKKLWMGLQAEEVIAHYDEDTGEKRADGSPIYKRKKSQLSELIRMFGKENKSGFEFTIKRDDTRRLYNDAMRLSLEVMDRFAKIQGMVKDVHISISRTETWSFVMADILKATENFPEAREAIVAHFEQKAKELPSE